MKLMKILSVLVLIVFSLSSGNAQLTYGYKKSEYFKEYLKRDIAVQLSGNAEFDTALRESINSIWKGEKKIVFMDDEEIQSLRNNGSNYSVIGTLRITSSSDSNSEYGQAGYGLYIPDSKTFGSFVYSVLAFVPFQCDNGCDFYNDNLYRIDLLNQIIHQLVDFVGDSRKRGYGPPAFMKQYNFLNRKDRFSLMEEKILLVSTDDLNDKFTKEDFIKTYRYNVEFVKPEVYKEILEEGNNMFIALISSPSNSQYNLSLMDLESKKLLGLQYGGIHIEGSSKGLSLSKKQIKMLQRKRLISNRNKNRIIKYSVLAFILYSSLINP
ncbi:MAG: hypothetical protein AB8B53_08280 [Flavobacteriales bacterium]